MSDTPDNVLAFTAPLNAELHVPGLWECAKCEFSLVQRTLSAIDGSVGDHDQPGEACPNCRVLLQRVSWRKSATNMEARLVEEFDRRRALEAEVDELKLLLLGRPSERRKWFIGQTLSKQGHLNRLDIMEMFGISQAIVSRDIAEWMAENPGAMVYNTSRKRFEAAPAGGDHAHG